jgi:hypothetical protein
MSKKVWYNVYGQTVMSLDKVHKILGYKVSKVDILDGKIDGVTAIDPDTQDTIKGMDEVIDNTMSEADVDEAINDILADDGNEDESDNEGISEDDVSEGTDDNTDEDDSEENTDEDTPPADNSLEAKLAKLRAMSEAHKAGREDTGKKGKKGKKVFDGNYPEVGEFSEEKEIRKFYKQLTDEQLQEWCDLEGVEYKPCDHQSIQRMRMCMAITAKHFPKEQSTSKKKSKYADFTLDQLVQMAIDNDVEVKDHRGDDRILRMYLIMALRDAGVIE